MAHGFKPRADDRHVRRARRRVTKRIADVAGHCVDGGGLKGGVVTMPGPAESGGGGARVQGTSPFVGRSAERAELIGLLGRARDGQSGALVVRGDAGIGKTRLLESVASSVEDFEILRLVGIESEMRLGFAALHQLLAPFFDGVDALPRPQARALRAAFGISDDVAPDQYLVGLAALTLVTAVAASRRPSLIVVDDAQWLDQESADALGFLGRRLRADRVCLFVSLRDPMDLHRAFDGLPSMTLGPLSEAESVALLESTVPELMADSVRARLLADAGGNPLALAEFGRGLTLDQLTGAALLPQMLAVDRSLEAHFGRQVAALPVPSQTLLLVAAAEPTGDADLVWRVGRDLNFDDSATAAAQAAGLLALGPNLAFRHPLIRSAVYQGASPAQRRRVHALLAAASDAERQLDQRAWHRAAAAQFPDEDVAAELERAAQRAAGRGSSAASAALLARSADLTPDVERRAIRFLSAAAADMDTGSVLRARANLERALPDLRDPILVARAGQLEGMIEFLASDGASGESVSRIVDAARALAPLDVRLARDVMLDTIVMARILGESSPVSLVEVAQVARSFELPAGMEPTTADLVLDASAELYAEGLRSATPLLRSALAAVTTDPQFLHSPRHLSRSCLLALALSDSEALLSLGTACATACRELGDLRVLMEALYYLTLRELSVGSLNAADDLLIEQRELQAVLQRVCTPCDALELIVAAWHGQEPDARAAAADLAARSQQLGVVRLHIAYALMLLELGLGNYHAAAALDRHEWLEDVSPLAVLRAADAVEAHVRSGNHPHAVVATRYIRERASVTESYLDLGLVSRCQALLADNADPEEYFRDSIAKLETYGARLHAARSQLLFGQWLRRQKRRRDAREQLELARGMFDAMGATAFAERARVELLATGAQARKRVDSTRNDLTPQESQIARMAAGGATNGEIAARLFISANTVDYHLRKVYRKLDIKSRHEIASVVSTV
jgi:DNA-binding CsgD family transcriptional regulator